MFFSISISMLFLIFLKNKLFSVFAPSKSEWLNSFTSTWMKNRQGPKAKKESTWMDSQIHEDPSPDTIELINFKYCQHRFFVSIDSDQKKGQCVFFEDANEHNSKIQFFNQLDKWNKFHIVMKWNRMSNMCNKKETILMKQIYKYIFIYKSIWRCNIYIWHIHCICMSYEKKILDLILLLSYRRFSYFWITITLMN